MFYIKLKMSFVTSNEIIPDDSEAGLLLCGSKRSRGDYVIETKSGIVTILSGGEITGLTTSLSQDQSEVRKLKRKHQKLQKREKQKREHQQELCNRFEAQRSIYDMPKKLLILDLNKVLLYRKKGSKSYIPRPHLIPFLQQMSLRFHLAIWTSMQKNSAHRLQEEIFSSNNIPLLFMWFQNRCVAEYKQSASSPLTHSEMFSSLHSNHKRSDYWERLHQNKNPQQNSNGTSSDDQIVMESQHDSQHLSYPNKSSNYSKDEKPIYHKPLMLVWKEFKYFNESNTVSSFLDEVEVL